MRFDLQLGTSPVKTTLLIFLLDGQSEQAPTRRASQSPQSQPGWLVTDRQGSQSYLAWTLCNRGGQNPALLGAQQFDPQRWEDVDLAASQYLEHVFAEGYPKGYGSDGLDLQHFNIFCLRPLGNSGTAGDSLNHGKRWNLHCVSCQSAR